ncbi:hypothetical protein ACFPRL_20920 [Pseudoclavibacter helvolus]
MLTILSSTSFRRAPTPARLLPCLHRPTPPPKLNTRLTTRRCVD